MKKSEQRLSVETPAEEVIEQPENEPSVEPAVPSDSAEPAEPTEPVVPAEPARSAKHPEKAELPENTEPAESAEKAAESGEVKPVKPESKKGKKKVPESTQEPEYVPLPPLPDLSSSTPPELVELLKTVKTTWTDRIAAMHALQKLDGPLPDGGADGLCVQLANFRPKIVVEAANTVCAFANRISSACAVKLFRASIIGIGQKKSVMGDARERAMLAAMSAQVHEDSAWREVCDAVKNQRQEHGRKVAADAIIAWVRSGPLPESRVIPIREILSSVARDTSPTLRFAGRRLYKAISAGQTKEGAKRIFENLPLLTRQRLGMGTRSRTDGVLEGREMAERAMSGKLQIAKLKAEALDRRRATTLMKTRGKTEAASGDGSGWVLERRASLLPTRKQGEMVTPRPTPTKKREMEASSGRGLPRARTMLISRKQGETETPTCTPTMARAERKRQLEAGSSAQRRTPTVRSSKKMREGEAASGSGLPRASTMLSTRRQRETMTPGRTPVPRSSTSKGLTPRPLLSTPRQRGIVIPRRQPTVRTYRGRRVDDGLSPPSKSMLPLRRQPIIATPRGTPTLWSSGRKWDGDSETTPRRAGSMSFSSRTIPQLSETSKVPRHRIDITSWFGREPLQILDAIKTFELPWEERIAAMRALQQLDAPLADAGVVGLCMQLRDRRSLVIEEASETIVAYSDRLSSVHAVKLFRAATFGIATKKKITGEARERAMFAALSSQIHEDSAWVAAYDIARNLPQERGRKIAVDIIAGWARYSWLPKSRFAPLKRILSRALADDKPMVRLAGYRLHESIKAGQIKIVALWIFDSLPDRVKVRLARAEAEDQARRDAIEITIMQPGQMIRRRSTGSESTAETDEPPQKKKKETEVDEFEVLDHASDTQVSDTPASDNEAAAVKGDDI